MVKLFCFILLLYIFGLLAYPCQDSLDISIKCKNEKAADHTENDCKTCPPFCACNCCQSIPIVTLHAAFETIKIAPISLIFFYQENRIKDIIAAIWQPPKA